MADILMAEARVLNADSTVEFIVPPGARLTPGHRHFRPHHDKGKTLCACCNAPVICRAGTVSSAGSSFEGRRAHFALLPHGKHDDGCDILTRPSHERTLVADRTKGYRIHINTREYSDLFNEAAGVYGRDDKGRIVILDPDLRDRERIVIKSAADLAGLLQSGNWKRISDSKVIFRNKALPWNEFFIRPDSKGGPGRYGELLERLEGAEKGEELFCAMVVPVPRAVSLSVSKGIVPGKRFDIPTREEGMPESIIPDIWARKRDSTHILWAFEKPGDYLVMGVPQLKSNDGEVRRFHHIRVPVDSVEAFCSIDLNDILTIGAARGRRRTSRGAVGPAAP